MNRLLYIFCMVFITWNGIAQENTNQTNPVDSLKERKIEVDEVEVIKDFEVNLAEANRIGLSPVLPVVEPISQKYNYTINVVPVEIDYPEPIIKPLAMNPDLPDPISNFYAKLGYGLLQSPFADLSYTLTNGDLYDVILGLRHEQARDDKEVTYRYFRSTNIYGNGHLRLGENHLLSAGIDLTFDDRNFYDTIFIDESIVEEQINKDVFAASAKFGIRNIETTSAGFRYGINLDQHVSRQTSFFGKENQEYLFNMDGRLEKDFGSNVVFQLPVKFSYGHLENGLSTELSSSYSIIESEPNVSYHSDAMNAQIGLDIVQVNDSWQLFPKLAFLYQILENQIALTANVNQQVIFNNFNRLYQINPFISPYFDLQNQGLKQSFSAGIISNIKEFIRLEIHAGYKTIENQAIFINSMNMFDLIYDDIESVFINGSVDFILNKDVTIGANIDQNFFSAEQQDEISNLPSFTYNIFAKTNLLDHKMQIKADIFFQDRIVYFNENSSAFESGNTMLDIGMQIDYRPLDHFGLWLRADNLIDREYLYFENFPGFGRNISGGLLLSF